MQNVFQEIHGAAAVISGPQPGGCTRKSLGAFSHDWLIRFFFVCLRRARRRRRRRCHLVTDSESTKANSTRLEIFMLEKKREGEKERERGRILNVLAL